MNKSLHTREYAIFCRTLRVLREETGLNQRLFAAKLGTTQTFISKCERGERRLDLVELRTWCEPLGIDLMEFVRRFNAACVDV